MAHMTHGAGNNRRLKQICGEPLLICERVSVSVKQPRHEPLLPRLRMRKAQTAATRWQPPRGCGLQQLCFTAGSYLLFNIFPAANLLHSLQGHCILALVSFVSALNWQKQLLHGNSASAKLGVIPPPPQHPPTHSAAGIQPQKESKLLAGCRMVI